MAIRLPQFPIEGGCVCAGIRYRVTAPPLSVYACHCKDCQRFAGGPYSMAMAVRREDVFVLRGVPKSFSKPADSGRIVGVRFCADCGTRLWHEPVHSPHLLNITAGTLDDMSWLKPAAHVWASRKMPWVEIEPGALSFAEQPQAREASLCGLGEGEGRALNKFYAKFSPDDLRRPLQRFERDIAGPGVEDAVHLGAARFHHLGEALPRDGVPETGSPC